MDLCAYKGNLKDKRKIKKRKILKKLSLNDVLNKKT